MVLEALISTIQQAQYLIQAWPHVLTQKGNLSLRFTLNMQESNFSFIKVPALAHGNN